MHLKRSLWVGVGIVLVLVVISLGWWLWGPNGGEGSSLKADRDQVALGRKLFEQSCASCHVEGGIGPELTPLVLANYRTAQTLFRYVSRAMPYDAPGSLEEQAYWDILAFLLEENGLLPEGIILGPETAPEVELKR